MNPAKRSIRQRCLPFAAAVLLATVPVVGGAEDIDIFVSTGATSASAANVLVVIDNTSNWADNAQHWPSDTDCGVTSQYQGQAELCALIKVIPTLPDNINVGVMLFNQNGSGNCCSGGYVRFAISGLGAIDPVTGKTNRQSLLDELNNILVNFSDPANKAASNASYSMALFDAFKYFGGYTSPALALSDTAGTPIDAFDFGVDVFATPPSTFNRPDSRAYAASYTKYVPPPASSADDCGGKDYLIFIGNGFPNVDTPPTENMKTFLEGVGGNSAQIDMPVLTTTTSTTNTSLGNSALCYNNNAGGLNKCTGDNASTCGPNYDTCTCSAPTTSCGGGKVKYSVIGGVTKTTVTSTGTTAPPAANKIRYADEWTRFLYTTDVSAALGQQKVTTFTIDAFNAKQNADQTSLLYSMANSGGGQYYAAKNKNDLQLALTDIFAKILATNSVFASASLPVSAANRAVSGNQVFLGQFRPDPDAKPLWYGNLKRYKIANFGGSFSLADVSGAQAVNPLTGFLDECTTSWWTTDSGKFWAGVSSSPPPIGTCPASVNNPFSPYSDRPDGPHVEKGAVAEVIRKGNNPTGATTWTLNRTLYTNSFAAYNTTNSGMSQADVDFIRGLNIDAAGNTQTYTFTDASNASQSTTIRPTLHGDVVHSRPLAINYPSNQTVVYYGANDGWFRAADSATGKELWAYTAPEFFSTLPRLRQNSPQILYPGFPAQTPPAQRKNYYFDGGIGAYQNANSSNVWIYPTMRRGGRELYALDVTSPNAPSLKWKAGCPDLGDDANCTSGFTAIGQTWSTPNAALLKVGGTVGEAPTPIVAVGGGYDDCEDGSPNATCSNAKGSVVYILDANNGSILHSFAVNGASTQNGTTPAGRVVADVAFVDLDNDGIPDLAYAVDTRGNIYRIAFGMSHSAPLAAANWTWTPVAFTTGANRKFLYAPALLPTFDSATGKNFVYLALGTGDREQPMVSQYPYQNNIKNRFYVFVDDVTLTAALDLDNASTTMNDYSTDQACDGSTFVIPGSGKSGWFMDLAQNNRRGEQTVTSAAIIGGFVAFSTNRACDSSDPSDAPCQGNGQASSSACAPLGEARGYAVNLFNGSGVIGAQPNICGGGRSDVFVGGGLPPSPVVANVDVDGTVVPIVMGVVNLNGGASSGIQSQKGFTLPPQARRRIYFRQEGGS
jgi:type IV pilus assembly protein PilY1